MIESPAQAPAIAGRRRDHRRFAQAGAGNGRQEMAKKAGAATGKAAHAISPVAETYRLRFRPGPGIFRRGINPLSLLRELGRLGECRSIAQIEGIPPLDQLDPEAVLSLLGYHSDHRPGDGRHPRRLSFLSRMMPKSASSSSIPKAIGRSGGRIQETWRNPRRARRSLHCRPAAGDR